MAQGYGKKSDYFLFFIYLLILSALPACLESAQPRKSTLSTESSESTPSLSQAVALPTGIRAAKIIFKATNLFQSASGSFDPAPVSGTLNTPGNGHPVVRLFNADGSPLAQSQNSPGWPRWLKRVEIGLSGSENSAAKNPACARFSDHTESAAQCVVNGKNFGCAAPSPFFRVSEYDCSRNTDTLNGNGGPNDGVAIRAFFNRDPSVLGEQENLLAVIEYTASSINSAPQNPLDCWSEGRFSASLPGCADLVWQIYLKHQTSELVQPYLLLVPPTFPGSQVSTKQFVIPLASDKNINLIQISRISGLIENPNETKFKSACNGDSPQANSPLCVGIIFHSLTFFRI